MNLFTQEESDSLAANKAFFLTIPWLQPHIATSGWTIHPTRSREPKSTTEDAFFAITLKNSETITHCLSLCEAAELPLPPASSSSAQASKLLPISKSKTILRLGDHLAGYPHIAHGGLLVALMDEQMGILLTANQEFASAQANTEITQMTVSMSVKYKRPVKLPGVVVVEAEAVRREGKRLVIAARVLGERGVCVEGEGIWVDVPATRL